MKVLNAINNFVWGIPALILILGIGLYIGCGTGFAQVRLFPLAFKNFCRKLKEPQTGNGSVSAYQALCTALAATVGTGNLAGVAGAITLGGPGSIFWMWICALLGMGTKLAEATLAVRFSERNELGETVGGPMYMIRKGLGRRWHWLAGIYCFFGVVAAFGVGNATQINTVIGGINSVISGYGGQTSVIINVSIGLLLAVMVAVMFKGGAKRIGNAAERLVPFAAVFYILICAGVLVVKWRQIPAALQAIIQGAFSPRAVTGGMLGSAFTALRVGASRGVFTNEAGMGTASIAHAAAKVNHPVEQGMMGMIEVFLDTILICTLTALVILSSGVPIHYGVDSGIALTSDAFASVYGRWISIPITLALCCFAVATILGWGLYGARCAQYLFGCGAWRVFACLQVATVVFGSALGTGVVWLLAETVNGLMAIPNLIVLALLSPELFRLLGEYKRSLICRSGS